MNIRVLVTHLDGTVVVYELGEKQLRLLAEEGIKYQLIDMETQIGPQVVYLTRSDDDLEVRFKDDSEEEPDLVIEDHFNYLNSVDLVGESTDGDVYFYTPSSEANEGEIMAYHLPVMDVAPIEASAVDMSETTAASYSLPAINSQWLALGGVVVLGGLALAAGGGGSASVANIVSGNVSAGPLVNTHGLTINLYGEDGQELAGNVEISANGDFSVDIGDYTGPILAQINLDADSIADYHDEGTGAGKDLDTALQAVGYADGNGLTLNVNPVTHLAARQILGEHSTLAEANADEQVIDQANEQTGELLGIDGDVTQQTPQLALDEEGQPSDASDHYGRVLAVIAGAEAEQGKTTDEVIAELLDGVDEDDPSSFKSDDEGDAAKELLSDGASKAADAGTLTEEEATDTVESIVVDTEASPSVTTTAADQLINAEDVTNGEASLRIRFKFNRAPAEGEFTSEDIWVNGQPHEGTITDLRVDENDPTVYWASFTPTEEGEFVVGVPAGSYMTIDGEENIAGLDVSITRDTAAPPMPELSLAEGQDDLLGSQDNMVEIIVSTSGLQLSDQIQLYLGEVALGSAQLVTQALLNEGSVSFMWPIDVLGADGHKAVTGRVTDRTGNEGEVSAPLEFTLDTTISTEALQVVLAEGQGEYINAATESVPLVVILGEDASVGDYIQFSINAGDYSTHYALTAEDISAGEVALDLSAVDLGEDGEKTIMARLSDEAGNLGPASEALSLIIDTQAPQLVADAPISISGTSDGETPKEGRLVEGDVIRIEVAMSEAVEVEGMPRFAIQIGEQTANADYHSEYSSADLLVFTYTIVADRLDVQGGITAPADALMLENASIVDLAGNPADVSSAVIEMDANTVSVDAVVPEFENGDSHQVNVLIGATQIYDAQATDNDDSNDQGIQYRLTETGDYELFDIDESTGELTLREASQAVAEYQLTLIAIDEAGNQAEQSLTVNVIDAPTVTITDNIVEDVANAGTIIFTFTFSEPVSDFTIDDITVERGEITESDLVGEGTTYMLTVTPSIGLDNEEVRVTLNADSVIGDDSGEYVIAANAGQNIDRSNPTIESGSIIGTTQDGSTEKTEPLVVGDKVRFELVISEAVEVIVPEGQQAPSYPLRFGSDERTAVYDAMLSTPTTLVFIYMIQENDVSSFIEALNDQIELNASNIVDAAGNDLDLGGGGDEADIVVDTVAPEFENGDSDQVNVGIGQHYVADITATDNDGSHDVGVQYRLAETGDYELFDINSNTGELTLRVAATAVVEYQLTVIATDEAGNQAEQSLTVNVVDAPTVTITDNISAGVTNQPVTFTFVFSEIVNNFAFDSLTITGADASANDFSDSGGDTYTLIVTPPADSTGVISVSIPDDMIIGESGQTVMGRSHSQEYDTQIPAAPMISLLVDSGNGEPGTDSDLITNNGALTVTAETGARFEYYVTWDGGSETDAMTAEEYQAYIDEREAMNDDGEYQVRVVAIDAAGNFSESQSITFTLDTTAPSRITSFRLAADSGVNGNDGITRFAGSSTSSSQDGGPGEILREYRIINRNDIDDPDDDTVAFDWQPSAIANNLILDGVYRYEVRETDAAGNISEVDSFEFTLDTSPPTAPVLSLSDDTGSSNEDRITTNGYLNVTYDTDDVHDVRYFVRQGDGEEQEAMSASQYQGFIDALVNNGDSGLINVRVELEDVAGNISDSTIEFTLDVAAPVFENGDSVLANVLVGVDQVYTPNIGEPDGVFSISEESVDRELFQIDPDTGELSFIEPTTATASYRVIIIATDQAGNQAEQNLTVNVIDLPTVTITDNIDEDVTNEATIEFTFTFSESVSDFTLEDINILNGSAASDLTGNGTSYRLRVTTFANSDNNRELSVTIPSNTVTGDVSGEFVVSNSHSQFYDNVAPADTPNAAIVDNGADPSDGITNDATLTAPTTNADTTTEYRLLRGGLAVYDWQETYEAPDRTDHYELEVRQLDAAGNISPVQTISFNFVAGVFDDIESMLIDHDSNNIVTVNFGDITDSSNTIDPNQFTVLVDGQDVGITDLSVSDDPNENTPLEITVDMMNLNLADAESVIVTYIAGEDSASRVLNQFGESYASGQGTTFVSYNITPDTTSGNVIDHSQADTNLIFTALNSVAIEIPAITVTGSRFNDYIQLSGGDHTVNAGAGDDAIHANSGSNILTGGEGQDTFVYINSDDTGDDVITDFELGDSGDVVELDCIVTEGNLLDTLIFSFDEQVNEILLQLFADSDARSEGSTATQTITLKSTDDLSAVTLQTLVDSGQLIIGI